MASVRRGRPRRQGDRPDAHVGLRARSRLRQPARAPGAPGAGAGVALEADSVHLVAVAARHEPLWKGKLPAGVSIHVRSRSSVAGRIVVSIPSARASRAVTAESRSLPAGLACATVETEIAVAEPEPVVTAELRDDPERSRLRRPGPSCAPRRSGRRARRGCCRDRARRTGRAPTSSPTFPITATLSGPAAETRPQAKRAADALGEEHLHRVTRPSAACVRGPARRTAGHVVEPCRRRRRGFGIAAAIAVTPPPPRAPGTARRCQLRRGGRRAPDAAARARSSSRRRPRRR